MWQNPNAAPIVDLKKGRGGMGFGAYEQARHRDYGREGQRAPQRMIGQSQEEYARLYGPHNMGTASSPAEFYGQPTGGGFAGYLAGIGYENRMYHMGFDIVNPARTGSPDSTSRGNRSMRSRTPGKLGIHGLAAQAEGGRWPSKFLLDPHKGSVHGMDLAARMKAGVVSDVGTPEEREAMFAKRQTQLVLDHAVDRGASDAHKLYLKQYLADKHGYELNKPNQYSALARGGN